MIDEATGYQAKRAPDDLQKKFARVFRENMAPWEETFDADWDKAVCRLSGHAYEGRPPLFIKNLNGMVYRWAIGEEAYKELKRRSPNPSAKNGLHHQHLQSDIKIKLSQTLNTVRGIVKLSRTPKDFMRKLQVIYSDAPLQSTLWD